MITHNRIDYKSLILSNSTSDIAYKHNKIVQWFLKPPIFISLQGQSD